LFITTCIEKQCTRSLSKQEKTKVIVERIPAAVFSTNKSFRKEDTFYI